MSWERGEYGQNIVYRIFKYLKNKQKEEEWKMLQSEEKAVTWGPACWGFCPAQFSQSQLLGSKDKSHKVLHKL